jgi:hypothetical protein
MSQAFLLIELYIGGLITAAALRGKLPLSWAGASAFLWGALVWVLVSMVVLAVLPFEALVVHGLFVLSVTLAAVWGRHTLFRRPPRRELLLTGGFALLSGLAALLFSSGSFAVTTNDSAIMLVKSLEFYPQGITPTTDNIFSSWAPFLPAMFAAGSFITADYLFAFQPMMGLSLALALGWLLYHILEGYQTPRPWLPALVVALTLLVMVWHPSYILYSVYIHTHMAAAAYLTLGVTLLWLYMQRGDENWLRFACAALLAIGLIRHELNAFVYVIIALTLSAQQGEAPPTLRRYFLGLLGALLITQSYVQAVISPGEGIWSSGIYALFSVSGILLFIWVAAMPHVPLIPRLNTYLSLAIPLMLLAALFVQPQDMLITLQNTFQNMRNPTWGHHWFIIMASVPLVFMKPNSTPLRLLPLLVVCYILFVLALTLGRPPYRVSQFDSGNRILFHIFPLVYVFIAVKAAMLLEAHRS